MVDARCRIINKSPGNLRWKNFVLSVSSFGRIASANELNRISKPLQSRFRKLFLPSYAEQQFLDVSEKVMPELSSSLARYIGANIWNNGGDTRDVTSIGKLVRKSDGPQEIELIMETMTKYGSE
jgi:hypothetical protein